MNVGDRLVIVGRTFRLIRIHPTEEIRLTIDHEGEVLEVFVTKRRDSMDALSFLKRAMKRYEPPMAVVTDRLRSYRHAMKTVGIAASRE